MARRTPPPRPYLEHRLSFTPRFQEVDMLRVVWHGHYASYFEEGRRGFGRQYGIDYTDFLEHEVAVPVVQLHIDYLEPARLGDRLELTTRLFRSESAKLEFSYAVRVQAREPVLATGHSVQVFTTFAGELILRWPPFMVERYRQWEPLWRPPLPAPAPR